MYKREMRTNERNRRFERNTEPPVANEECRCSPTTGAYRSLKLWLWSMPCSFDALLGSLDRALPAGQRRWIHYSRWHSGHLLCPRLHFYQCTKRLCLGRKAWKSNNARVCIETLPNQRKPPGVWWIKRRKCLSQRSLLLSAVSFIHAKSFRIDFREKKMSFFYIVSDWCASESNRHDRNEWRAVNCIIFLSK